MRQLFQFKVICLLAKKLLKMPWQIETNIVILTFLVSFYETQCIGAA